MRDVEDAVPYGSETVGGLRDGGRGKPLPYGDGCTGVRDVQRDAEDAVPTDTTPGGGGAPGQARRRREGDARRKREERLLSKTENLLLRGKKPLQHPAEKV